MSHQSRLAAFIPIPQPKEQFLLKNLRDVNAESPVLDLMKLAHTLGPIYRVSFPGGNTLVVVSSRELVHELCDESRFDKKVHSPLAQLRAIVGDGLFTAHTEEPNWGKAHRLLMPAFGPVAIREMFEPMLDIAEQLLLRWERFGPNAVISVPDDMTRLTLDTIALCAFDYRFNSFYQDQMHPFVDAMMDGLREALRRGRRFPVQTQLMVRTRRKFDEDVRFMHQVADDLITRRKVAPHSEQKKDLLGLMLQGQDPQTGEGLSEETIRNEMVTFLIAGHETTSGLLSFTLYLLLKHPHILQKARAHVDEILGLETPCAEDLARLPYIEQVLKESLRLWPTAPAFGRQPREDTILGGRYQLEKGANAFVLIPVLHRDPTVWGDDPERFDPDRFTPEAEAALPEDAYKPFGTGQRACIGRAFAMQEAQLVLSLILQRFDLFEHDPAYQLRIKETLTLKPEGFFIRARRRNPAATPARVPAPIASRRPTQTVANAADSRGTSTPLLILYGSNAGSAEAFARRIASDARNQGFVAEIDTMDARVGRLPTSGAVVIVTASYEGLPPDNAKQFVAWVQGLPAGMLAGVRYGVFGCGHRDWVRTYQAIPTKVDAGLESAGATRILPRGEADAGRDFFGDFEAWYGTFWITLAEVFGKTAQSVANHALLEMELLRESRASRLGQSELNTGVVIENRELVDMSVPNARSKRHLKIQLPEGETYRAGDYLAVLPTNPDINVTRVLKRFGFAADQQVILHPTAGTETALPTGHPVTVQEILSAYVELSQPATRKQIEALVAATPCPPECKSLEAFLDGMKYEQEILDKRVSLLDLLERNQSCSLSFAAFLAMLPTMRARQYSISSSPLWDDRHCTVTVAVVDSPARSGQGRFLGTASNYLTKAEPGTRLAVAVRPSNIAFHPPASMETPLIMICSGTGIAPFRGFVQERALRAAAGGPIGRALLFFGCRHPDVDYLYRDEWEAWERQGVVEVRPAFSAIGEDAKYVQDRLWQDRVDVAELFRRGAMVFVCGDGQRLLPVLRETGARIYQEATNCTSDQAIRWLADLEQNHSRYYADLFS